MSFAPLPVPHRIPFLAVSAARRVDDQQIEGTFLCSAGDALAAGQAPLPVMVFEAMAQLAGSLVFSDPDAPGFLTAIDGAELDSPLEAGDLALLSVRLDATLGGMFRFSGTVSVAGVQRGRAKFYLSVPPEQVMS